ncbi:MAG TPA: glycoside hydrolase family 3 C-terminal domain-containing protein [Polyangiaceae bacterium]|nr:glycoside hydrolase family 3 C-terminal domain-containing protein [Polyangiaceae bacterium]
MSQYPFFDPTLPPERRIDDLLGRMHLDEKIACFGTQPDVPRLGVVGSPHIEGYHGVAQGGPSNWGRQNPTPTTQFPQAYGLGSTWSPELVRRVAEQMSIEARALFQNPDYARGGLVVRAPNADIGRDPRWGRTEEVYGEDPFHVGVLSAAFARGLQGDDERYWRCASLLKHFCANSNEDDRTSSSSNFDERLFREYYAWAFEVAVAEGGSRALMAAYNAVNGTPAHIHPMLEDVVAGEWGVDGIICSDGGGLRLLVSDHQAFPDLASGAAACIKAGINQFLDQYIEPVTQAVERGLLTEADLDVALRGVFRVMLRLGLLDPPERVPYAAIGRSEQQRPWEQAAARELAREVTRQSIVLLENRHGTLPLDRSRLRTAAIVGPRCNEVLFDWYSGMPPYTITPRDGIERVAGAGVSVGWVGDTGPAALELVREREVAIVCVGNHPEGNASWARVSSPSEGKEAVDRKSLALPSDQEAFVRQVIAANPNTIVVLISNFPVAMPWVIEHARAVLHVTHCSQELGTALGDVIFGDCNPGGKLAQTWPRSVEQLPPMLDYDIRNGRTYLYSRDEPQYSFGYGLSYTSFELAQLATSADRLTLDGSIEVSVELRNTGERDGDEVVQLYVHHLSGAGVERPERALKGFRRVHVAAGATQRVSIPLRGRDLAYWNAARQRWDLERGSIELWLGTSSRPRDIVLRKTLQVHPDR